MTPTHISYGLAKKLKAFQKCPTEGKEEEMRKIWIVEGATGEYSDHCEWPVCAFANKEQAKKMVELCSTEYRRIKGLRENAGKEYDDQVEKHRFDPNFKEDYTGTVYKAYSVKLFDSVPE